jgi:GntR family transcriptional regulator, transcriptional repressor for pyruvate dehydrogenase complex
MPTRRASRKRRSPEVANRIQQYIVHHGLEPGDLLPVHEELSQKLGVGLQRLREGLSVLKHQGFIETRGKGGTHVRRPTFETLSKPIAWHLDAAGYQNADLVVARACLESGAAAVAAESRTARDLLVMLDALEQLEALTESDQNDLVQEEAYHTAILQATHNPVIITFSQLIRLQFQSQAADQRHEPIAQRRNDAKEHRRLYECIERSDSAAARNLMYAHVIGQLKHPKTSTWRKQK